ncbi:hypothetical protein M0R04_14505 [Candidatus Dojkabacteria bacterium]|jgi:hypothetical protein|nr:hypothetical protein [Candidatus Dojkabacteria bacterium]
MSQKKEPEGLKTYQERKDAGLFEYYISKRLRQHWDKNSLKEMKRTNQDRVYIVDGMERVGKSTWAIQQMCYLDEEAFKTPESFVSRIVFSPEEFAKAIVEVKNGVIVFDEAFRGLASRSSMSKVNKKLIQGLMEMGQNNNIVFIVLPRIWLLDIYPAMLRSHGLFNLYVDKKSGGRVWRGWNMHDKNVIYQMGAKKGWKYLIRSNFRDRSFAKFPGGSEYEKAYLAKKALAFREAQKEEKIQSVVDRWKTQALEIMYAKAYFEMGSGPRAVQQLKALGISVGEEQIRISWHKWKHLVEKVGENPVKPTHKVTGYRQKMRIMQEIAPTPGVTP